ncbi:MAG TPA: MMPL family transporter [Smithellaceae bacterium]|nr:MMPL family transporter [Smithellaceae bacterium]
MTINKYQIRWSLLIIVAVLLAAVFVWNTYNLKIETDILESLPRHDQVLVDARQIIKHLPVQDRVFIEISQEAADKDRLVASAVKISNKLKQSRLFTKVGLGDDARNFPELIKHITENLPVLFSETDLEQKIKPLLGREKIKEIFIQNRQSLQQLEGIGRSEMITRDPLGFSGIILANLSSLMPANNAQFYQGQLISGDGRHALLVAHIAGSGTDTKTALQIRNLISDIEREMKADYDFKNTKSDITAAGAYNAALDNETAAKRDTRKAIILAIIGISLLLLLAFPRPLIGLLALLPSTVGAITSLFVCSFFFPSISMLAIGFGGAIMAFTVDLGITYLLFLDQTSQTYGKRVAHEVWKPGLLAALTTAGAFLLLHFSDFIIMAEIGLFAALGVLFTLLFVHMVFPSIIPTLPPASRSGNKYLQQFINKIAVASNWKLYGAAIFAVVMLLFARPVFQVDINSLNSVSAETITAEKRIQNTWGDFSGKSYLFVQAANARQLQEKNDKLSQLLAVEVKKSVIKPAFLTASAFPSSRRAEQNQAAWNSFWNKKTLDKLKADVAWAAKETGFSSGAFSPFWQMIKRKPAAQELPEKFYNIFGINKSSGGLVQLSMLSADKNYDAESLSAHLTAAEAAKIFDAGLFSKRLGETLKNIFLKIALITAAGIVLFVFLLFLDWQLSLAVLAPVAFALISTLGTLKIIGHPLDIPSIMLWIVVMGMGIDYAINYVCFYQRYREENNPAMNTVKMAMFLSSFTTFIGFGALAFSSHALLKSIGVTSLLGIGYSIVGAYLIVPALMKKIYATGYSSLPAGNVLIGSKQHRLRVLRRYRHAEAYVRLFARCKMIIDPMFKELHKYMDNPRKIMDIGCGFGIPAVWLLEIYPAAKVYGLEPDEKRVRAANYALGERGFVKSGLAPDLPVCEDGVDTVLMLDMIHLLSNEGLMLVLQLIYDKLSPEGRLIIRATVPTDKKIPWKRWIEKIRLQISETPERFRSEQQICDLMQSAGFKVGRHDSETAGVEEKWFVGRK